MITKRKFRTKEDKMFQLKSNAYDEVKYTCKCGHKVIITAQMNKKLCDWCGHYVFRNKEEEFRFRMKGLLK